MRATKQLLWWLIAGSEGGLNRARIIDSLKERPCNANQLADKLKLDYKTVRHHLDVLLKNNLVTSMGERYGKMYYLSHLLESEYDVFEEIWERIGKKNVREEEHRRVTQ